MEEEEKEGGGEAGVEEEPTTLVPGAQWLNVPTGKEDGEEEGGREVGVDGGGGRGMPFFFVEESPRLNKRSDND